MTTEHTPPLRLGTLDILYLKPETHSGDGPASRNLVKELRERYWTKQAEDAENRSSWIQFAVRFPFPFDRQDVGRNREQPGDGFRFVFSGGSAGIESRVEWFEITEVFAAADPRDVEAFMRVNNALCAYPGFEAERFLAGLDLRNPSRSAQRRAADQVIAAIDGKLRKPSYAGMTRPHGYGTLVVGLPLWFASPPADPLRDANVLDDFYTRVAIGLRRYRRRLAKPDFPFWRIVVVWHISARSLRDSKARANMTTYQDPAYRRLSHLPTKSFLGWDLVELMDDADPDDHDGPRMTIRLVRAHPAKNRPGALPAAAALHKANLEAAGSQTSLSVRDRIRWRLGRRVLEAAAFAGAHGHPGLRRWAVARLSPHFWIDAWTKPWRLEWLYEESRRRQATRHAGSPRAARRRKPLLLRLFGSPWRAPVDGGRRMPRGLLPRLLVACFWLAILFWTAHWTAWTIFAQAYVVDAFGALAKATLPLLLGAATSAVWLTFRILAGRPASATGVFVVRATRSFAWLIVAAAWAYWSIWLFRDIPRHLPAVAAAEKLVLLFLLAFGALGALAAGWLLRRRGDTTSSTQ